MDRYSTPFKLKSCPWPYVRWVFCRAAVEEFVTPPKQGALPPKFSTSAFTEGSFATQPVMSSSRRLVLHIWSMQRAEVHACFVVLHSDVVVVSRKYLRRVCKSTKAPPRGLAIPTKMPRCGSSICCTTWLLVARYPDSNRDAILDAHWQICDDGMECSILNTRRCPATGQLQLSCSVNGAVPQWYHHSDVTPIQPITVDYKPVGNFCVTSCVFVTSNPTIVSSANVANKGHSNVENRVVEGRYEEAGQ